MNKPVLMKGSRRVSCCLLFLLASWNHLVAQHRDSISLVTAPWKKEKVSKGVDLFTHQFSDHNLFGANQYISYLLVNNRRGRVRFALAAEPKILRTTSDFAKANVAIAAINGNFFDVKNGGAVDFTKVRNRIINISRVNKGNRSFHQKAAIVIKRGRLMVKKWDGRQDWEQGLPFKDVMLNGPLLFFKQQPPPLLDSSAFNANRHPRTAAGILPNGRVILLVADGRNAQSAGLSIFELTRVLKWLGCETAINFDGGGSSTLWTQSRGVVNHPSDNKKWDHEGERKVANILMVKKKRWLR